MVGRYDTQRVDDEGALDGRIWSCGCDVISAISHCVIIIIVLYTLTACAPIAISCSHQEMNESNRISCSHHNNPVH